MSLLLLFRPFGGSGPIPPPPVVVQAPSGVRKKKRELIVSLRDVADKESTADFLKSQLNLRHPQSAFVEVDYRAEKKRIADERRREKQMREKAALEAKLAEEKRQKRIRDNNERAILLALIAAELDDL